MLIDLAISILWLLIGVIIILGVVWLGLYVVKLFVEVPGPVEKAIWAIVLILILIAALSLLAGRGSVPGLFRHGTIQGPTLTTFSTSTPAYMSRMLILNRSLT